MRAALGPTTCAASAGRALAPRYERGAARSSAGAACFLRLCRFVTRVPSRSLSAHFEAAAATVLTSAAPPLLFDYYEFPVSAYELKWPAPGATTLAARATQLLDAAGIPTATGSRPHRTAIGTLLLVFAPSPADRAPPEACSTPHRASDALQMPSAASTTASSCRFRSPSPPQTCRPRSCHCSAACPPRRTWLCATRASSSSPAA